jgi:site-specific DNA recombinase
VREEVIAEKFSDVLGRLSFGDDVLQWVSTALRESHADQRKEHDDAIARLQAECERLQNRIHAMYIDKLDGRIDRSFYVQMSEQWRVDQEKLMQEITLHQAADQCYLDEGVRLLELAHSSQRLFAKQEPNEKRRLLNFVLSNSTWKSGALSITFRQPFDLISEIATSGRGGGSGGGGNPPDCPSWWRTQS